MEHDFLLLREINEIISLFNTKVVLINDHLAQPKDILELIKEIANNLSYQIDYINDTCINIQFTA